VPALFIVATFRTTSLPMIPEALGPKMVPELLIVAPRAETNADRNSPPPSRRPGYCRYCCCRHGYRSR
jgi:hypothetical protein